MYKPLGFEKDGVIFYIFATKKEVNIIAITKAFTVNARGKTFKETIAKAKRRVREEASSK